MEAPKIVVLVNRESSRAHTNFFNLNHFSPLINAKIPWDYPESAHHLKSGVAGILFHWGIPQKHGSVCCDIVDARVNCLADAA